MNDALTKDQDAVPRMARTILVVDDEATLRETVVDALEAEGFRVIAAADGREALTRFRADRPDLILADRRLGSGDSHGARFTLAHDNRQQARITEGLH